MRSHLENDAVENTRVRVRSHCVNYDVHRRRLRRG